jgi:malate dehydrogenase
LLEANAQIFSVQGEAINQAAARDIRVLVVGNPANTNALITQQHAPDIDPRQITGMTRLDHNRAIAQLAAKVGCQTVDVKRMIIWGNHSTSQYPDLSQATVAGEPAISKVDEAWYKNDFIPTVADRGAAVIKARGASSAASAAAAAINHMHDWILGTPDGDWVSMAVPSDGSYGIKEGVIYSYPVVCKNGTYTIVPDLAISDFSRDRMQATEAELRQERSAVAHLFPTS